MDFIRKHLFSSYKRFIGVLTVAALALAIPITLTLINQQQDIRQRADFVPTCPGNFTINGKAYTNHCTSYCNNSQVQYPGEGANAACQSGDYGGPTCCTDVSCPSGALNPSVTSCTSSQIICAWSNILGDVAYNVDIMKITSTGNIAVCRSAWNTTSGPCAYNAATRTLTYSGATDGDYQCFAGAYSPLFQTCNQLTGSVGGCRIGVINNPIPTPLPTVNYQPTSTPLPTLPQQQPRTWSIQNNLFCSDGKTIPTIPDLSKFVKRYTFTQSSTGTCNKAGVWYVGSTINYNPSTDGNCAGVIYEVQSGDVNTPYLAGSNPSPGITVGFDGTLFHSTARWSMALPSGTYSIQYQTPDSWCSPTIDCTAGPVCSGTCTPVPTNSCSVGTKTGCVYTTSSNGLNNCKQATAPNQTCYPPSCFDGKVCSSGTCVTPTPTKDLTATLRCDLNKDGKVSILDFGKFANELKSSSPVIANGDCNGDGLVTMLDFGIYVIDQSDPKIPH